MNICFQSSTLGLEKWAFITQKHFFDRGLRVRGLDRGRARTEWAGRDKQQLCSYGCGPLKVGSWFLHCFRANPTHISLEKSFVSDENSFVEADFYPRFRCATATTNEFADLGVKIERKLFCRVSTDAHIATSLIWNDWFRSCFVLVSPVAYSQHTNSLGPHSSGRLVVCHFR